MAHNFELEMFIHMIELNGTYDVNVIYNEWK